MFSSSIFIYFMLKTKLIHVKMKSVKIILLILTTFLLLTCEEKTFNKLTGEGTLLKEIAANGEIYYNYTYNDANLIQEEKSKFRYTEHHYNNKDQLLQSDFYIDESISSSNSTVVAEAINRTDWVTTENTQMNSYTTFEYDTYGQLKKTIFYQLKDSSSKYSTYVYNNGKMEKRTTYINNEPAILDAYYYDQNGNLIKEEKYNFTPDGQPILSTSTEYQFDDKNNMFISFRALMIPGEHTNKNNILKKIYTIFLEDGSISDVQTTDYSYEYNGKGFPERRNDGFEYTYY